MPEKLASLNNDENKFIVAENKNPYVVLSVEEDASAKDIQKAYKKKAMEFHPDKNKSPEAGKIFNEITIANNILKDEKKRASLDDYLKNKPAPKVTSDSLEKEIKAAMKNNKPLPENLLSLHKLNEAQQLSILNLTNKHKEKDNLLTYAIKNDPKHIIPILQVISRLKDTERVKLLLKADKHGHNALLLITERRPEMIDPMLRVIGRLRNEAQVAILKSTTHTGYNALSRAAKYKPEVVVDILEAMGNIPTEDRATILKATTKSGGNALSLAAHNPECFNAIKQFRDKLPSELTNTAEIKGSKRLFDVFAKQPAAEKEQVLNFSYQKFLLCLCKGSDEKIQNDFKNLINTANTPRFRYSLNKGNTASCDDLIKKLSEAGQTEKGRLKDALGLEINDKDLSPKAFKAALEKYVKSVPKAAAEPEPSPEKDSSNAPRFH